MQTVTGIITEIKKFATHDGPGIRTTVFLKGCPLRCKWCANPETQNSFPELFYLARLCNNCGQCHRHCPAGALVGDKKLKVNRDRCIFCFQCIQVCPNGALKVIGKKITVHDLVNEIAKDLPFYGDDGGVTVSGGEPLLQSDFTLALLKMCYEKGIRTALDTSGYGNPEIVNEIIQYTDLVMLDIKHMDDKMHLAGTGVSNRLILENARLMAGKAVIRISLPLIPGFNDSENNIRETAFFARSLGVEWIDINPMHSLGKAKYLYLGRRSPYHKYNTISTEKITWVRDLIHSVGILTTVGRMM